ncbi:MAG: OsmC family protein [Calditrichaeota bacterium]|nr:OsmC family protein [Calditrichota bacterium]
MKSARVKWVEGMQFVGRVPSGHSILMDATNEVGGTDSGARPKELLLAGLGGCTGMDVVSILRKMRVPFDSFEMEIRAESSEEHPKIWTKIELVYRIVGDVPEDKFVKAITLSQERYCSVSAMLRGAAAITFRHEILPPKKEESEK